MKTPPLLSCDDTNTNLFQPPPLVLVLPLTSDLQSPSLKSQKLKKILWKPDILTQVSALCMTLSSY